MVDLDENVKASWAQVINVYQRRADLIPNLVEVVKGYATHEKETLTAIADARSRVGSVQLTPEMINDPAAMQKFSEAQGAMTSALSRLMVVVEKYPDLKASENFRDLSAQLEGAENRIAVERKRFIEAVAAYNSYTRKFPQVFTAKVFGFKEKPTFTVENEKAIGTAPTVKF
jgi:LemA protein